MGTILASAIIDRAEKTLLDESNVQWSAAELLDYLNAGVAAVVAVKPDVYVLNAAFTMAAGAKQVVPAGGLQVLDVVRNTSSKKAIRFIDRSFLDQMDPDWQATTGSNVLHYTSDSRDPKTFYVYPGPAGGAAQVDLVYAAVPAAITSGTAIPLDDIYQNALYNFILAHAYAKNAKRGDTAKYDSYMQRFYNEIGTRSPVQAQASPPVSITQTGEAQ